jgi:very-short-patch-repair endonuclease
VANPLLGYQYRLYNNQTKQEQALEKEVAKLGVRYRTQHLYMGAKAIVDFLFPDYALVVEVDDPSHDKKKAEDQKRTERLQTLGLKKILRYSNYSIDTKLSSVIEDIKINLRNLGFSSDDQPSSQSQPLPQSPSQEPLPQDGQPTHVKKGSRKRSR